MNKFDMMGKDAFNRVEEIMNATKLNEFHPQKMRRRRRKRPAYSGFWQLSAL